MKFKIYLFIIFFVFFPLYSNAAVTAQMDGSLTSSLIRPFGGNVLFSMYCTCSNGQYILLYDKTTLTTTPLVFQWGVSRLNRNYNIMGTGQSLVGTYIPGTGVCLMYVGTGCTTIPTFGLISTVPLSGVGTSLK
jgi:hypothetical protein